MYYDAVATMQLKKQVEKILNSPINKGKDFHEIAVVYHGDITKEQANAVLKETIDILRNHIEEFKNMRVNVISLEGKRK